MNFTLAYCIENRDIALEFDHHLRMAGFTFDHISCDEVHEDESLEKRINDPNKPVLLLISDNFLKSPECMYRALFMIQSNVKTQHIQSIIIDGRQLDNGGSYKAVPTNFDRVSNVIQYMNYWQEQYLDMRKTKRESDESNPDFDRQLKIVRSVSSEVGEFLRVLRSTDFWTYDQFIYNDYEIMFDALGQIDAHQSFKSKMKTAPPTPIVEESISAPNIDLATIPGISLLDIDPIVADVSENNLAVPEVAENVSEPETPLVNTESVNFVDTNEIVAEIIPSKITTEATPPIEQAVKEAIIPTEAFPKDAKEVTPMVEIEEEQKEEQKENETNSEEYPDSPPIEIEDKDNPLLEKMIDYQKESMSEVEEVQIENDEIEELSQEEIEKNLEALILESESYDKGSQLSASQNEPPSQKESYEILQSIFDDEEDEDEEEMDEDEMDDEHKFDLNDNEQYKTIADLQKDQGVDDEDENEEENEEEEQDEILTNVPSNHFANESSIDNTEEIIDFTDQTSGINSFELNSKAALQKANILITSGEIDRGLKIIENILVDEPYNTNLRYKYASYLAYPARYYPEAIDQLEELILIDPKNTNAYILLAELAVEQNDFLLAKSYYEKALSMDENRVDIYYRLGVILDAYFEEQRKKAGKYFRKVIKMDAHHVDAHYRYALILTDLYDKDKKAIYHLEEVLLLDPRHPFANYDMALIFYKNKKRKKAARFYKKAYLINPELKTLANDQAFKYPKKINDEEGPLPGTSQPNVMTDETLKFLAEEAAEEIRASKVEDIEISFASDLEYKPLKPKFETTKTVLITGATSGIGRATAEEFATKGYRLILTGRRTTRLDTLKIYFEKRYESKVAILPFDVRDIDSVQQAIDSLDEEWKEVDILINNAGLAKGFSPIHEGNLQDWETMIDTNIKGLLYLTRVIAPQMVARKSGHIINIGSSAGKEVYPNGNVYCATKHAVEALTKAMRIELHQHNIRVSQVSPGHVEETEFAYVRFEDKEKAKIYEDFQPLKAKDVAEAIYFMVSRPNHVNIQDIVLFGTQQASNIFIDRTGRKD